MKSRSDDKAYAKRVGALTVVTVLAKVVGALYRIPLTNVIGAEGVGVYQLVFSIYALAIALTSSFHTTLISRQVAAYRALDEGEKARGYFLTALLEGGVSALLVAGILFLFGEAIAGAQGAVGGGVGYRVISPAVLFVSFLSALKGWFNGNMRLAPTAASLLIEQTVKLGVGLSLAYLFRERGAAQAAAAALFGVTTAEAVAVLVLAIVYLKNRGASGLSRVPFRTVFREGLPLRFGGVILPLAAFADSFLIVRLLFLFGVERSAGVATYGIYAGAVNSIVNFPVVLVLAVAVAIIPVISRSKAMRDVVSLKEKSTLTLKIALVISLPCALALLVLAPQAIRLLYPVFSAEETALAAQLLRISSASVVFLSLTQIYAALLQSIDRADVAAEALAVSVLVRVILLCVLVPRVGAIGIAVSGLVSYALTTVLDLVKWLQYTGRVKNAVKTLASVGLSGGIMVLAILAPAMFFENAMVSILTSAAIGSVIYFLIILRLHVFSCKELMSMPFSSITTKIGR